MGKICPFLQKECIEKKCMAWNNNCLLINKNSIQPPISNSKLPTKLTNINHEKLVRKLQRIVKAQKYGLDQISLNEIYLESIGFDGFLSDKLQDKLDKAVNQVMSELLDQMYPSYFITDGKEELARRMFKWIINNSEVSNIWQCQQEFLKEHNINEDSLSFNGKIRDKYNISIRILWEMLTAYKEKQIERERISLAFKNVSLEMPQNKN